MKLKYNSGAYLRGFNSNEVTYPKLRLDGEGFNGNSFGLGGIPSSETPDTIKVEFYYEVVPSTKVIVRHLVKQSNGKYEIDNKLANKNTVVINAEAYNGAGAGSYIIVNNRYSQRKSIIRNEKSYLEGNEITKVYNGSYSELYEIDANDKISIGRSRTLMLDGTYYKCIGFKTKKSNDSTPLDKSGSGLITTSSLNQTFSGGSEYIFIDYYYDPEDYSKDVYDNSGNNNGIGNSARLKFMPKAAGTYASLGSNNSVVMSSNSNANENENIAYVPVTENLKPYVVTDMARVRKAKYDISLVNGNEIKYGVAEYETWGVSDDPNMANVQNIIGTDVKQVYNNNTYMNINTSTVQGYIASTINYLKNISKSFSGDVTSADNTFRSILNNVSSKKTDESYYYNSSNYNVPSNKYNGLRQPTGNISYKIYTVKSSGIVSKSGNNNSSISKENSMKVNIYTPVAVGDIKIKSIDFVNHSNVDSSTTGIIQQGIEFSVTVSTKKNTAYPSQVYNAIKNTGKYVKYWYLMFDFDVTYNGHTYKANEEWIRVNAINTNPYAETVITGLQATTDSTDMTTINSSLNHVKVIGATLNLPSDGYANTQLSRTVANKVDTSIRHIDKENIKLRNSSSNPQSQNDGLGMKNDSYYLVSNIQETINIGRIFDFEITDCLDVNYKDVFRNINSDDNTVNSLTGTRYFSGIRRLLALDSVTSTTTNTLLNRSNLVVGSVTKVLPLGPYKHTTNSYIQAVKLGYRFSFDVKTSGYYDPNSNAVKRSIRITPSYYYISKDGKTYNDNIKLYYKNSSGNYVDFQSSNYTIYYKPNDGYRNTYNSGSYNEGVAVDKDAVVDRTTLTTSLTGLNISKAFTLSSDKSMTTSDNKYLQAWYGEFKIPNSTIALAEDKDGKVDINNPLSNGYIGVKFKMECIDKYSSNKEVIISYDNNDTGLNGNNINTTQWDFEGYLGFKENNIGRSLSSALQIQLENGIWNIGTQKEYENVKGTVIFYDLDDRAANDYD